MIETLHYLTDEEERAIKQTIPWESIDYGVRNLVRMANNVEGLATLQSCAGHISPQPDGFSVDATQLAVRATKAITTRILFEIAPRVGIRDISLRYWNDGTFWMNIETDPADRYRFYELFEVLQNDANKGSNG